MIRSKREYHAYLEADRVNLGVTKTLKNYLFHDIWRYQRLLRRLEYQTNCKKGRLAKVMRLYLQLRLSRIGTRLGFSISPNTCGPGLSIAHKGTIVINRQASVGANCRLHVCVNIGATGGTSDAPQLGNNVYIAPGAKLFGRIRIADGVAIGTNAVVNKSFDEPNITIGGIPAKKISDKGSSAAGWTPRSTYLGNE